MLDEKKLFRALEGISDEELNTFREFMQSHSLQHLDFEKRRVDYMRCGSGAETILTFAGGWGPPQLIYETALGFEGDYRLVVVDISPFAEPESMCRAVDKVLEKERVDKVILLGQSFTGIIAQIYFRSRYKRVKDVVLTNTPAPKKERCKKWALFLLRRLPLSMFKPLIKKKLARLSKFDIEITEEAEKRMRFRAALMMGIMDQYFTPKVMRNALSLAFVFNQAGAYKREEFTGWKGRVLLVTSEDESYYSDAQILADFLPGTEMFKLPVGCRHIAPLIYREQFQAGILSFLKRKAD